MRFARRTSTLATERPKYTSSSEKLKSQKNSNMSQISKFANSKRTSRLKRSKLRISSKKPTKKTKNFAILTSLMTLWVSLWKTCERSRKRCIGPLRNLRSKFDTTRTTLTPSSGLSTGWLNQLTTMSSLRAKFTTICLTLCRCRVPRMWSKIRTSTTKPRRKWPIATAWSRS